MQEVLDSVLVSGQILLYRLSKTDQSSVIKVILLANVDTFNHPRP